MIKYTESKDVPTNILVERLAEIVDCITNRHDRLLGELTMSIPVRLERDADCVLDEVGRRLVASEEENEKLKSENEDLKELVLKIDMALTVHDPEDAVAEAKELIREWVKEQQDDEE